jgi:hypothetical protein
MHTSVSLIMQSNQHLQVSVDHYDTHVSCQLNIRDTSGDIAGSVTFIVPIDEGVQVAETLRLAADKLVSVLSTLWKESS